MKINVAYFSMEIMLRTHIPTYAGGLGVLAGDLLRSCADMEIPTVGMTLVYNGKAFNQVFQPDGTQNYTEIDWRKSDQFTKMPHRITLKVQGQDIVVGCWRYDIVGYSRYVIPVYLLDTDYFVNPQWARDITADLYGSGNNVRICQEIVLGIGGIKMLRALGYTDIDCYHLNESHSALVPVALEPEHNYIDSEVKKKCVFTIHTPIPEGHDSFDYETAYKCGGDYLPWHIRDIATTNKLDMTYLALNMSKYSFGVSRRQGALSRHMFPGYNIGTITNGVHHRTWTASTMQDLYNQYLPEWLKDPAVLAQAPEKLPDSQLWEAHQQTKKTLVSFINKHLTSSRNAQEHAHPDQDELFDTETLTIALARRPVRYKRPLLIYRDLLRLTRIGAGKIQIIQSGKSHPSDDVSKGIVQEILRISKKLKGVVRIVYIENYSPKVARLLVSGSDVWLNTPQRPLEASGTSGMKAAMNGCLNFSVLDGWWIEGYAMRPDAGFAIGALDESLMPTNDDTADSEDLYSKLEHEIIPLYYTKKDEWVRRMKQAIALGAYFNTNRCIQEYMEKAWNLVT